MSPDYKISIQACLDNGERLLSDALMLEFSDPPSTALALAIIAQEEFAKAFILTLIHKGIIKWNKFIWRATRDHTCKQLLTMIMDYLTPNFDELIARIKASSQGIVNKSFPSHVADALNIFYHEKIRKYESSNWFWDDPPKYDHKARKVVKGKIDKLKQDQLYIDIGKDGLVSPKVGVTKKQFEDEKERAERLCSLVRHLLEDDSTQYVVYEEVFNAFQMLFENRLAASDDCLEMCHPVDPPVDEDATIPLEVSNLCNLEGKSLVRAWREYKGLTQREVAGRMGVSRSAYARMEASDIPPSYSTLKRLAHVFGVKVDQLTD